MASTAWMLVSWHCRRAHASRERGASLRKKNTSRSSGARANALSRSTSPSSNQSSTLAAAPPLVLHLLVGPPLFPRHSAHDLGRPAVDHALVGDEVEHGPARARRHRCAQPRREGVVAQDGGGVADALAVLGEVQCRRHGAQG